MKAAPRETRETAIATDKSNGGARQPDERVTDAPQAETGDRIQAILKLDSEAERHETAAAERRWRQAELVVQELEATGRTQRSLAEELRKSPAWVTRMKRVWAKYGDVYPGKRPPFQDAWHETLWALNQAPAAPAPRHVTEATFQVWPGDPRHYGRDLVSALDAFLTWAGDPTTQERDVAMFLPSIRSRTELILNEVPRSDARWDRWEAACIAAEDDRSPKLASLHEVLPDGTRRPVKIRKRKAS